MIRDRGDTIEIFSFNLSSDFGAFRAYDTNDTVYITYIFPPKTAVLGILGSISGKAKSTEDELPWYDDLKEVRIAIKPLSTSILRMKLSFNNSVGYANYDKDHGDNLIVNEQILIEPKYRIYVELNNITEQIYSLLRENKTVFTPYLGKNEFRAEISDLKLHNAEEILVEDVKIDSIWPFEYFDDFEKEKDWLETIRNIDKEKELVLENYPYAYSESLLHMNKVFAYYTGKVNSLRKILEENKSINGTFIQLKDTKEILYLF